MTPLIKLRLETALGTSSGGRCRIALELAFSVIPGHLLPRAACRILREERHVKFHILAVGLAEIMPGFGNLRTVPCQRKWDKRTTKSGAKEHGKSDDGWRRSDDSYSPRRHWGSIFKPDGEAWVRGFSCRTSDCVEA